MEQQYNRAKPWQLFLFILNNAASNIYLMSMGFVNLFAGNVAGIAVMLVSNIIMVSRVWDGITDPLVGFIMDKTNGKFGKFRPFMLLGNIIMFISAILMFCTLTLVPEGVIRVVYWTVVYLIYIVGYTFQNAATRGGQTVLTNDPKQRPMIARLDGIITAFLMAGLTTYITQYLTGKHGGFTASHFVEMTFTLGIISLILTILAVIGIWDKDQPENYANLPQSASYGVKDIFRIIRDNRAIQMLIVAASTDKLAKQIRSNSVVGIMLYGIIMGNYALLSRMSIISIIPNVILLFVGSSVASKFSSKNGTIIFSWASIIFTALLAALMIFGDPTQISLDHMGFMTIGFILLYVLANGSQGVTSSLATPMIADCADYEMYMSGRYAPGLMGTVFGFFDKVVSSFSSTIVGWCVVAIGFTDRFPTIEDPLTSGIFWMAIFMFMGIPIIGWICSLIAMKFYPCDKEKMVEVQAKIADMKKETAK